uniref:Uncharacterized protein n=1 Tax=Romanomermis culicivorax TaxID=13658 RepID=A0A915I3C5_ROMCU
MGVIISFAFGILLSLFNNVIRGANNNFEQGMFRESFPNQPGGIFTSPEKPQVPFYTNFPVPYYPNPVAPPVAGMEQQGLRILM